MPEDTTLESVLRMYMKQKRRSVKDLHELSGNSPETCVPLDTIRNWLEGSARKPRYWQDLVQVATAFPLTEAEANHLLQVAQKPPLRTLFARATEQERRLFYPWAAVGLSFEPIERHLQHNVRPPRDTFTGRTAEVEAITSHFLRSEQRGLPVVVVQGQAGVGKTEVALVVVQRLMQQYPDAQLVFDLQPGGEALAPALLLSTIVHVFTPDVEAPETIVDRQSLYRSTLRGRRGVLVLDNALDDGQIVPLLPPPPGWAIIVTSRTRVAVGAEALLVDLKLLPRRAARKLLRWLLANSGRNDIVTASNSELDRLAQVCGHLPLALRLASAHLIAAEEQSLDDYCLALEENLLDSLQGDDGELDRVLERSIGLLEGEAPEWGQRWRALGIFPASWSLAAAAAVWNLPPAQARFGLKVLHQRSLVDYDPLSGRYGMHDVLRAYALRRLPDPDTWRIRHARHFLDVARWAEDLYVQGGEQVARGLALFDQERAHTDAAWTRLLSHEDTATPERDQLVLDYAEATVQTGNLRYGKQGELIPHLIAAIGAAERLGRQEMLHWLLGNLGTAYAAVGQLQQAITFHERRLALASALDDQRSVAIALNQLGNAYADLGDLRRAIDYYEQSLAVARAADDERGEVRALGNLGIMYKTLDDYQRAVAYHQQSLQVSRKLGDLSGEAVDLGNLGNAYRALGDLQRARECHEQALKISRELGDRRGEGFDLCNLGNVYADAGDECRAIGCYQQYLALTLELDDRRSEANARHNLADSFAKLGDEDRAIEYWEQALAIRRELGNRQGEASTSWYLGELWAKRGEYVRAVALMQVGVDYFLAIGHPEAQARVAQLEQVRQRWQSQQ